MLTTFIEVMIAIPLIFFLPGYIIFKSLYRQTDNRRNFFELLFLQIVLSILITGWIALVLAETGLFSLPILFLVLVLFCVIAVFIFKTPLSFHRPTIKISVYTLVMAFILLLAIGLFFHPFPWILGGRDPGVYVNTGINIAKSGSIIVRDPFLAGLDADDRQNFYQIGINVNGTTLRNRFDYEGNAFPGYYITNSVLGEITPQFFFLWPTWIAIFYSLFGLSQGLYVTPFFALISIVSVFYATKTLFDFKIGILAAFFLTINSALIWYARYPTSEVITLFLIFAGIYTFVLFNNDQNTLFGFISALCFGEAFLTRIDAPILIIPLMLFFIYLFINKKFNNNYYYFIIPLIFFIIQTVISGVFISYPYVNEILYTTVTLLFGLLNGIPMLFIYGALVFVLLCLIFILFWHEKLEYYHHKIIQNVKIIQIFLIILVIVFIGYDYFLKTLIVSGATYSNSNQLFWYVGGLVGLILSVCGCILIIYRERFVSTESANTYFFISIFFISAFLFINNALVASDHPWWIRRFLPVVIPSILICISYLLFSIISFQTKYSGLVKIIFITLFCIVVFPMIVSDLKIVPFTEYDGAIEDLSNLSTSLDDNSFIFFPMHQLNEHFGIATPLTIIFQKRMVQLRDPEKSEDFIYEWLASEKSLYFIDFIRNNDIIQNNFTINEYTINLPTYVNMKWVPYGYFVIPTDPAFINHTFTIVKIQSAEDLSNEPILAYGWYDLENWGNTPTRWISNNATILYFSDANTTPYLKFSASSFQKARTVTVYLNDIFINQTTIPAYGNKFSIPLPMLKGANSIRFFIPEGCTIPSNNPELKIHDDRCISIAVRNLTIQ